MNKSTADLIAEIRTQARTAYQTGDPDRQAEDANDADPAARIDRMRDELAGILDSVRDLEAEIARTGMLAVHLADEDRARQCEIYRRRVAALKECLPF